MQKGHVYYRCTTKACATKTIREEVLAEAVDACLTRSALTDDDVAAFRVRIEAWVAGTGKREVERNWQLRRANLLDRIDRLTDALVDRLIEKDVFAERRKRLALEEEALNEEWRELKNRTVKADQLSSLIELAKNVRLSHQLGNSAEKRKITEMATSNRVVRGKEAYLEPSDWLDEIKNV